MTSIDKTLHQNLRRTFRSGVGAESLAQFEPAILRNLAIYFSQINRDTDSHGWSTPCDMRKWSELEDPKAELTSLTCSMQTYTLGLTPWQILVWA